VSRSGDKPDRAGKYTALNYTGFIKIIKSA